MENVTAGEFLSAWELQEANSAHFFVASVHLHGFELLDFLDEPSSFEPPLDVPDADGQGIDYVSREGHWIVVEDHEEDEETELHPDFDQGNDHVDSTVPCSLLTPGGFNKRLIKVNHIFVKPSEKVNLKADQLIADQQLIGAVEGEESKTQLEIDP